MKKKALIFLRHYNDIDHIVPVIWKWSNVNNIKIVVIIDRSSKVLDDYRIRLIDDLENIRIFLLDDFLNKEQLRIKKNKKFKKKLRKNIIRTTLQFYKLLIKKIIPVERSRSCISVKDIYDRKLAEKILNRTMRDVERGLVVFDWISDNMTDYLYFAGNICNAAHRRNFKTVSLPHGDEPHYCRMIRKKEINYKSVDLYTSAKDLFDYIVVPNELCAKRYYKHMGKDRIKILGSPRFNDEWLSIIGSLLTPYKTNGDSGKLKIVFYLRSSAYPIFWEEVVNTMSLIKQFSNVYLIVVHHTRPGSFHRLTDSYPDLKPHVGENSRIVNTDIHSTSLIGWADVILDIGTSAVFEAIKLNKPVLELEYLHATYTTISHYMPKCVMMCRDHLYNTIKSFINNGCTNFYSDVEKEHFLKEVVDVPDSNVLDRYVRFMDRIIE